MKIKHGRDAHFLLHNLKFDATFQPENILTMTKSVCILILFKKVLLGKFSHHSQG